jgi:alkylation response protein AidB-like acyl-CoA dehydrogenase
MEFSLTDEQLSLQSMITQWCASRGGTQQVRDRYQDKDHSLDPAWAELAELGLAGLLVDPACGGSGGSLLDACIVAEALSASLLTVPFVGSAVLGATAVELFAPAGGRQEWLGEIADGRSVVSVVLDRDLKWPAVGREGVAWEWVPTADVAWMEDGQLVRSAGPKVVRTLDRDLTRTCAEVQLPGDAPGSAGKVSPQEALFLATGRVITAASLVGTMAGALRLATEHAKSREQFGRPIGSFQAIQHMCAEMLVDVETSRTATFGAAWAAANLEPGEALRAASVAKAWAASASRRVCESAMQVHGGMGYTWECDVHLYLRSAQLCGAAFGDEMACLDSVSGFVFAG